MESYSGEDLELDFGGHNPELDFGGPLVSFSCEKFPSTIVCYRKHCRLVGEPCPPDPPLVVLHVSDVFNCILFMGLEPVNRGESRRMEAHKLTFCLKEGVNISSYDFRDFFTHLLLFSD